MPAASPARLLVVDDEVSQMNALCNTLGDEGFIATGFSSSIDALAALREREFDLVLTDLEMPVMNGIEFLRHAVELDRNLVGIVMTGHGTIDTAVAAMKAGALDYVLKPFKLTTVLPVLNRALEVRRLRIENIRLQQSLLDRTRELQEKNRQMEEELQMAREFQMAMMPSHFPSIPPGTLPEHSSVHFHSVYRPAGSVSGDFFDVIPLAENAVGVFIGDVMGHDVRAALITAMLRALVHEFGTTLPDPAQLLAEVNRQLCGILKCADPSVFATGSYLVIDPAGAQVLYANAGHPAPLHVQRQRGEVTPLGRNGEMGPALGMFPNAVYHTRSAPLTDGDCLMLFTDGLFEIEDASEEIFGQERLREQIFRRRELPAAKMVDHLFADLQAFSGDRGFADDICLLAVEVNGKRAEPVEEA